MIYPPGSEAVLADNFEGKPFSRPNDVIVAKTGGVYFTEPGLTAQQAEALVKRTGRQASGAAAAASGVLHPAGRKGDQD